MFLFVLDLKGVSMQLTVKEEQNLKTLLNAIEEIKEKDNSIYLKFKKDVIIEANNMATIANGFSIQYANQIHFNPDMKKEIFKEMVLEHFNDIKLDIIKGIISKLELNLSDDEVEKLINGEKQVKDYLESNIYEREQCSCSCN